MSQKEIKRIRKADAPTDTGNVILFDSTVGLADEPSATTGVGAKRGFYANWRFKGHTKCTTQNVTVELDYLEDGAWGNVTTLATVTAGTPAYWDAEPESADFRIRVAGSGTAPSAHESVLSGTGDLEA